MSINEEMIQDWLKMPATPWPEGDKDQVVQPFVALMDEDLEYGYASPKALFQYCDFHNIDINRCTAVVYDKPVFIDEVDINELGDTFSEDTLIEDLLDPELVKDIEKINEILTKTICRMEDAGKRLEIVNGFIRMPNAWVGMDSTGELVESSEPDWTHAIAGSNV